MEEHDIRQRLQEQRYDEAFDLLVARAKEKIFRLSVSMLADETQAQDLTQEVLVKIWKALPRYSGAASLSTWIYAITRNTCLTELKRRSAHPTVSLNAPEMEGLDPAAADTAQAGAQTDVETLLARLPERYRRVITLFYLEQKSYEELAAMLGMPLGTVKTMLFRGRQELLRLGAGRGANRPSPRLADEAKLPPCSSSPPHTSGGQGRLARHGRGDVRGEEISTLSSGPSGTGRGPAPAQLIPS